VVGGEVRKNTLAMVDATTIASIEPLFVDTLFISDRWLKPALKPWRLPGHQSRRPSAAALRIASPRSDTPRAFHSLDNSRYMELRE